MISKNFKYSEFERSDKAKECGIDNTIPEELKPRIKALVDNVLQPLRDLWGAMPINSGYRCRELNEKVGGVESSQHRTGEACDVRCSNPQRLAQLAKNLGLPYDQIVVYPNFLHISHKYYGKQRGNILYNKRYKGAKVV